MSGANASLTADGVIFTKGQPKIFHGVSDQGHHTQR